ncbi:hypothetical protein DFP92_1135 [Yoonia sediminilitoris]|uniref:Uncharacterized protein n=1 Tax=Yoonia sediminilitoris TaxID=1286148 RepID=A0A2T6K9R2_9RHOB|nr:hypothetical protein C8N45_1135 [Yoonia sediminilitoris]RCW91689.1 hypothetical protein DFP92_1135 [Yoonia sediminilitoris]
MQVLLEKHKNSAVEPLPEVRCGGYSEEQDDKGPVLDYYSNDIGTIERYPSPDERRIGGVAYPVNSSRAMARWQLRLPP